MFQDLYKEWCPRKGLGISGVLLQHRDYSEQTAWMRPVRFVKEEGSAAQTWAVLCPFARTRDNALFLFSTLVCVYYAYSQCLCGPGCCVGTLHTFCQQLWTLKSQCDFSQMGNE